MLSVVAIVIMLLKVGDAIDISRLLRLDEVPSVMLDSKHEGIMLKSVIVKMSWNCRQPTKLIEW